MPRAGLTPDAVVAGALDVVDAEGWDGLSLTVLAARLGVKPPSLYKHVSSLAELREDVAAVATRELAHSMAAAAVGLTRGDALRAVARAYRGFALAHPGRYAATVAAPRSPGSARSDASREAVSVAAAIVDGYGLASDSRIHAIRAVRAALHGFVSLELSHGFGLPEDVGTSFELLVGGLDAALASWDRTAQDA
ncbi:TetR/AcrR family transcriptional regulator [Demequina sp.]|uniref:TetR/AcrR family transcriptional regulator n=1 Tax=Demequina sp. TaxID=2050685 RepID=UPI0025D5E785|nr:TetR/AcrR family transcriptional regulator [Demequina sp.]